MTEADRDRFIAALGTASMTFNRKLPGGAIDGYWLALKDLPIEAVERGISSCLQSSAFMPPPVAIRMAAGVPSPELVAEEAWATVVEAVGKAAGESVLFQDGITGEVVRQMGLLALCEMDRDQFRTWAHKQFVAMYMDRAAASEAMTEPSLVGGWLESGIQRVAAPYLGGGDFSEPPKLSPDARAQRVINATADFMRGKLDD